MQRKLVLILLVITGIGASAQAPDPAVYNKLRSAESSMASKIMNFTEDQRAAETDFIYQRMEWLIRKVDSIVKTGKELSNGQITVYPNPFTNRFRLEVPSDQKIVMTELYDLPGRLVFRQYGEHEEFSPRIPPGHYLLIVKTTKQIFERKLIKADRPE